MNDCTAQPGPSPTCRQCIDFLMAYLDGELPERERASFDTHLSRCPPCRDYLQTYMASVRLCESQREGCGAGRMPEEMVRAILAVREAGRDGPTSA